MKRVLVAGSLAVFAAALVWIVVRSGAEAATIEIGPRPEREPAPVPVQAADIRVPVEATLLVETSSGEPLPAATVVDSDTGIESTTDDRGHATCAATRVRVTAAGYFAYEGSVPESRIVVLRPTGRLTIELVNEFGNPVEGFRVHAFPSAAGMSLDEIMLEFTPWARYGSREPDGFRWGHEKVEWSKSSYRDGSMTWTLPEGGYRWMPGSQNQVDVQPPCEIQDSGLSLSGVMEVRAGEESRYRATVHTSVFASRFVVDGAGVQGATIRLYDLRTRPGELGTRFEESDSTTTELDGRFEFAGVRAGKKLIRAYWISPENQVHVGAYPFTVGKGGGRVGDVEAFEGGRVGVRIRLFDGQHELKPEDVLANDPIVHLHVNAHAGGVDLGSWYAGIIPLRIGRRYELVGVPAGECSITLRALDPLRPRRPYATGLPRSRTITVPADADQVFDVAVRVR